MGLGAGGCSTLRVLGPPKVRSDIGTGMKLAVLASLLDP